MARARPDHRRTALALLFSWACVAGAQSPDTSDWGYYGGDVYGQKYSNLTQIDRSNVAKLEVAWTYRTGELGDGFARADDLTFEATPVLAFGMLYLSTGTNIVIALDPVTGTERWRYDPRVNRRMDYSEVTSRGVTVWEDPDLNNRGPCSRRVFMGTIDARLIAIDAGTGKPCADFGTNGAVDLAAGMNVRDKGDYQVTSPPAVFDVNVIVGSSIGDNTSTDLPHGTIRGFDARTGAQRWAFDPVPAAPAEAGAANAWTVMTVDPERGLVYVPTGSASPDFYGGKRLGQNNYANSLLALEAASGKLVWHQQTVHHDLWDFDLAAPPALVDLELRGTPIPAVIQATKTGMLFVFDRGDGQPLVKVADRDVPRSTVRGEQSAATQPFSSTPALVTHRALEPADAWGITFWDRGKCRDMIRKYRNEGLFTPPDERGTILWPSYLGGVNWGGVAFDQHRQRVIAAVNHLPMVVTLMPPSKVESERTSEDFPNSEFAYQHGTPYAMRREPFLSPWGLPCTAPPWGTLVNVDLRENRIVWQVPLGSTEGLTPWFVPSRNFGTPNLGGPIATAGELVFVGAAMDGYFRAYDLETGRELWKHKLPAGGQATPMTYRAGKTQRQFVVISAGGHGGLGTEKGDYVVAFALPGT
jgi:quinoprotein glucose dehydrogenase